ncbi:MAG: hypothetical protein FWE28_02540 [Oscillospiraceae bacterium]|nr:hypothetical protein [Oscillospiraceae bacterium]
MKCRLNYCIYNRDNTCLIEEVQLDELGMCQECMIVSLPEQELNMRKEQQLQDISNRDAYTHKSP